MFSGIILFIFFSGHSQTNGDTIYFDQNWNQASKDKASYFRVVSIDTQRICFMVRDHYLTGQLQMEGAYRSINPDMKMGKFLYWYQNGNRHIECFFKEGKLEGQYREWYDNGILKTEKSGENTAL